MGKKYELDITLMVAGMPMSGDTIPSGKSLGGSETCGVQFAEALARKGHHVMLFCNTEKPHIAKDVFYVPIGWTQDRRTNSPFPKGFFDYCRSTPSDVVVVQRIPNFLGFEFASKCNLLWQHDLATRTGPSRFHDTLWNINKIIVPSDFMRKQYQQVYSGPGKLYKVIGNGIDIEYIRESLKADPVFKPDRFRLTYTSRPERGLDILLRDIFPLILQKEPRAKLYISRYEDPATLPLYQELEAFAKQFGDKVVNMGNLGKAELYKAYRQSRLLLYPTQFEEIFMLTAQEAGACGLPMVASNKAALSETCGNAHLLIKEDGTIARPGDPTENGFGQHKPEFIKAFVDEAVALMHDDERWERMSKVARERAEQHAWDDRVDEWVELMHEIIAERSSDPRRMVKHFLVNSDVVAARKYAETVSDAKVKDAVDRYAKNYMPFFDAQDQKKALAEFYEERSGGDRANWQTAFFADREPRTQVLIAWLRQRIAEGKIPADGSLLDFGCAHGGYVRAVSNAFPSLRVVGVDVSPSLIRCAAELLKSTGPDGKPSFEHPENVVFLTGDEDHIPSPQKDYGDGLLTTAKQYDVVVCMETIEHLPWAEETIGNLEKLCKPDGSMIFTVPYGHRERDEFVTKGIPPVHVRSFDLHDVRELFGKKPEYSVATFSDYTELEWDKTMPGWFMVTYKNDGKGPGEIDWERKFFLQGPRETLAVCVIANNTEHVLHRCLRSVAKYADQIIVVDNGPSQDRTAEVAAEYTEDVRAGTSPFWCYAHLVQHHPGEIIPGQCDMAGFETPRNESIEGVWTDHILWIDCDEQLLEANAMAKYLRPNVYNGYAIQQHHISVDPPAALKRDIPVRIFRNRIGMKFYGLVHEHAEFGINKGVGNECVILGDFHIHHDGYLTESIRRGRFHRNLKMLECDRLKYPDRLLGIFLYEIRDNTHLARYALERSGGFITPEVQHHCRVVIDNFRKHFLANDNMLFEEGINYYSDALAILGLGIEVLTDVDVKKTGANFNGGARRFRVMDKEEAKLIIGRKIEAMAAPLEGPYVQ